MKKDAEEPKGGGARTVKGDPSTIRASLGKSLPVIREH